MAPLPARAAGLSATGARSEARRAFGEHSDSINSFRIAAQSTWTNGRSAPLCENVRATAPSGRSRQDHTLPLSAPPASTSRRCAWPTLAQVVSAVALDLGSQHAVLGFEIALAQALRNTSTVFSATALLAESNAPNLNGADAFHVAVPEMSPLGIVPPRHSPLHRVSPSRPGKPMSGTTRSTFRAVVLSRHSSPFLRCRRRSFVLRTPRSTANARSS